MEVHGHEIVGVDVGAETRCAHYDAAEDIVALKFACCERYVPCFRCHEAMMDHDARPWPADRFHEPSVLCGHCGRELAVEEYLQVTSCPACETVFNPNCAAHYDRYFEDGAAEVRE